MRSLYTALHHVRRSPYQAFTAILMMTLTFLVAYSFILLLSGAQVALQYLETRPQVTAYFMVGARSEQLESLQKTMQAKDYVASATLVTSDQALQIFREDNKKDPLLIELVSADILPASLEVSAKDIASLPKINEDLKQATDIDEVVYHKDVIENLSRWTNTVRVIGIGATLVHGLIGLLFIFVIIGFRVAMKRSEIAVMQLLGASGWYISAPFMAEGIIYGISGAIFGWIACFTILLYLTPSLLSFFGTLLPVPVPFPFLLLLLGAGSLAGIFIGCLASVLAVRRFLRS